MFNPYHKWLGIPTDQCPPTYYQLLGVAPYERDPEVIEEAAIRQTSHLRSYQLGEHAQECTRLLNEIAQARSTLLSPAKRKEYDAKLAARAAQKAAQQKQAQDKQRGSQISKGPPRPAVVPGSALDELEEESAEVEESPDPVERRRAPKNKRGASAGQRRGTTNLKLYLLIGAGAAVPVLLLLCGGLAFLLWPRSTPSAPKPADDKPVAVVNNPRPQLQKLKPALKPPVNPVKEVAPPKQPGPALKPPVNPVKEAAPQPAAPAAMTPDWSGVRLVNVAAPDALWKVTVKPAAEARLKLLALELPAKQAPGDNPRALVVSGNGRMAAVGYHLDERGKRSSRVVVCDLAEGKVLGQVVMPGFLLPTDASNDGTQVLLRRDEGGGNCDRLELWSMSAEGGSKKLEFNPYGHLRGGEHDLRWAIFLDEKRLLTCNGNGKVALWDLPAVKPLYQLQVQVGMRPALSPDRKLLAFTTGKDVGVLDLDAGQVVAMQPTPAATNSSVLGFSPAGKWLACSTGDRLFVWDLATGALHRDIPVKGAQGGGYLAWSDDRNVLLGGRSLINLDSQIRLWDYHNAEAAVMAGGLGWFLVHDGEGNRQAALVSSLLPHPAAEQSLQRALGDPNFIVLRSGTAVRLDVSGLADAGERDKVAATLTAQLKKIGCSVDPNGTIDLVASTKAGKVQELFYYTLPNGRFGFPPFFPGPGGFGGGFPRPGGFGGGFPGGMQGGPFGGGGIPAGAKLSSAKVQEHFSLLKFVFRGQATWEKSVSSIPQRIQLEKGETVQQYLSKRERPNYAFYQTVELPPLLLRSNGTGSLGSSRVTRGGVQ